MSLASRIPRAHARSRRFGVGSLAAEVVRDPVVVERVGRRHRIGVAAHPLDPLRRDGALPQADQPEARDAPARERVELLVRDRVERPDVAAVAARQLVEPDVGALGHEHDPRHPGRVASRTPPASSAAPTNDRLSTGRPPPGRRRPPPPPKRRWSAVSSSARIPIARSTGRRAPRGRSPRMPRPVLADVAQLAGQRRRRATGRQPHAARRATWPSPSRRRPAANVASSPAIASR